jgi:hypothetical protein
MITLVLSMLNFLSKRTMKGEKPSKASISSSASIGSILRLTLRLFQFVMGITVIGLYAQDLYKAKKVGAPADGRWVFATFTGSLSAFSAIVLSLPLIKSWSVFALDALLFFFWMVNFGIFGKMYLKMDNDGGKDKGIVRMQRAAWIDMVNMLLWFISAVYGAVIFFKWRKGRTSRASQV